MERLTADGDGSPFIFEGTPQKLWLISNNSCYGPHPQPNDEVEQHLSITADGRVFFSHIEGNPPDVIRDPLETKDYRITINYLYGEQRVLTGSFDKNGLPDDFSDFAETIFDFMCFYGIGEILNPTVHSKVLRKQTDFIFCNVQFDEYGNTYCYLTDDTTLEVGHYVIVPVGKSAHESVAKIESIEYHPAEDAPFPLDRIKRIICKSNGSNYGSDSILTPEGSE